MKRGLNRLYLILMLLAVQTVTAMAQCAMCRGAMESSVSAGDTTMAANLNLGILYMFIAPYILFGTLAYFWYRNSKRNGKKVSIPGYTQG